ncbi:MAG TPA: hypothetical protein VJC09_00495 [Candidatus Saccharimonadales bacterium]|nr:hypothetical protein [Candidatus Saccharimonadales bacterium]
MNWIGISGSWRYSLPQLEQDVRRKVTAIVKRGDGIVTGGALGVDFIATARVLEVNPSLNQLKVIIPTDLTSYLTHYRKQAQKAAISGQQSEKLASQLMFVQKTRPEALIEGQTGLRVTEQTYLARNKRIAEASDSLIAFQVNNSTGTGQTIDHARKLGKPVTLFAYQSSGA